ncbi:MAG: hypothetical protein L3J13_03575, partial [Devosiaceae bacterium]|nr:hypothetical protein [Devosiaceae bacterium]
MTNEETSRQLVFDLGYKTSLGLADFIVTDANELAFDHINNWARWPGPLTLITGPAKSGKTHLARIWAELSGAQICTASQVENLAQTGGTQGIVLDDVERCGINEGALFHLLNQSMRDNRPVLMTARTPIATWNFHSDDVKSRARLAAHFTVLASDDLALCQMFAKLFDDTLLDIAKLNTDIFSVKEDGGAKVILFDRISEFVTISKRDAFCKAI